MVRFVCVSDTHSLLDRVAVPDGDVLIHAGDLSAAGAVNDIAEQFKILSKMPHEHVVVIAGNHDLALHELRHLERLYRRRYSRVRYLQGTSATVAGVKLWGSPWTPWFRDWAFNFPQGSEGKRQAERHYATIPTDTQLLLTHGPPRGILDELDEHGSKPGAHAGGIPLRERIRGLPALRAHVFGHIHCGYGAARVDDVLFVNAAICTEEYMPTNLPIVIDWNGEYFTLDEMSRQQLMSKPHRGVRQFNGEEL
jgi:Icc-related predicted phosphoesterase